MPDDRIVDVELVVTELLANSIDQGGGSGTMRLWTSNGHLVLEVRDRGVLTDPLAGAVPPVPAKPAAAVCCSSTTSPTSFECIPTTTAQPCAPISRSETSTRRCRRCPCRTLRSTDSPSCAAWPVTRPCG
ncbi:MAG TPA: hypothetical protein VH969_03580 [Actinophytocola sp.]|jgi:hypothetical protein|uniref:hypothetical protein n=1 Tax=Actinophytocola sp. TaxID=1872138 RepID=UPI002F94EE13